jgi:hypothetical protein
MNRRSLLGRFAELSSSHRAAQRPDYFHPFAEPLEERQLLSAVTWNVVQASSSDTITIPDQTVNLPFNSGTIPVLVQFRNESGGAAWTSGDTASMTGTIATNYVDGSSIQFLTGQNNLTGVDSGTYRPDPSTWDATAKTFATNSTAPAVFGARIHGVALGGFLSVDVAYISIPSAATDTANGLSPLAYDLGSPNPLTITAGTFPANSTSFGINSGTLLVDGLQPASQQVPSSEKDRKSVV